MRGQAPPAYLAGHSLGEYNALLAAGVFDFLTGLRLVKMRSELMARERGGGMAAVIGLRPEKISEVIRKNGLTSIDVANLNSPLQAVISGPADEIRSVEVFFEAAGAQLFMPLKVSGAFHSRSMAGAAAEFARFLGPMSLATPRIPVVANSTADFYPRENASETIKSLLVNQITCPVRWTESIRLLQSRGVTEFKEVGPGNVLTRLQQQFQQQRDR
jgi:malonyl CoA-acyl carrier protein transacylase